jgi:hypothetical protein
MNFAGPKGFERSYTLEGTARHDCWLMSAMADFRNNKPAN